MGVFNAGLPNQGGIFTSYLAGDIRQLGPQSKLFFNDDMGAWLRLGNMIPWSSSYSNLMKNHKGYCIKAMPSYFAAVDSCAGANAYYNNSNYVVIGGANSIVYSKYGADFNLANNISSSVTTAGLTEVRCSAKMSGGVIVVGGVTGSSAGLINNTNNGSYSVCTGISTSSFSVLESNGVALGVAVIQSGSSNGGNHIYTTVNGAAFTPRTGTGGTLGGINGAYWSPCANAFLFNISGSALNKTVDGFTQTAVTLPGGLATTPFVNSVDSFKTRCASSATSTIIVMADGRLLRTTDGVNFSVVDPSAKDAYLYSSLGGGATFIGHDGTRYILYANATTAGAPTFLYSEDDGLTWTASFTYESLLDGAGYGLNVKAIQTANGKLMVFTNTPSGAVIQRVYDMTSLIGSAVQPDKVGSMRAAQLSSTATTYGYLKVA